MANKLYRVSTQVDQHDFDGNVLEDFTVDWIVTGRERPPAAYLSAVTDWSTEAFADGDPAMVDAVDAVNQMFTKGQADSLAMFLKNTQGWESQTIEVSLPVATGARPLVGGNHQIQIPPGAITFLPGQGAYVAGLVGAVTGSAPQRKPDTARGGTEKTPQRTITTGPAAGMPRGIGVSIVGPVGKPAEEGEAREPKPSGTGRVGMTVSHTARSEDLGPAPVAPELRGAAPASQPAPAAPGGDRCEACERAFGGDTSQLRAVEGHTICIACLDADRATAVEIARARHRAYLQKLKASLGGQG